MTKPQTNQQPYKNPQEILEAVGTVLQSFTQNQGQEVVKQLNRAWSTWTTETLQNPQQWMDTLAMYQQEQLNLWMKLWGMPLLKEPNKQLSQPDPSDRRFAGKEWQENPVFDYLKQSYLLTSHMLLDVANKTPLDEKNHKKFKFYTQQFIDAMSPTNFVMTNPEVIQQAIESKGQSLIDGLKNLVSDVEKGYISMTEESKFKLGENLAITPGAVVYENEIIQLIQYKPTTPTVSDRPVLIVPPSINKYYILDLQPDNSFVKFVVDQGNTTFIISWINPGKELCDCSWDDYISSGVIKAFEMVKEITGAKKVNTVAWCVGGTFLATALAVLHEQKQQNAIASATFLTTMLDFAEPGDLGVFIDDGQVNQREMQLKHEGMLSGADLAVTFRMLRANDLIWSYVVNNYLKGKSPQPFDILYWNSDPTNLPAKMYSYYLRNMYMDNKLVKPNALTVCGVPINLHRIKTPVYFLSAIDDHIAPWKSTFAGTSLFAGPIEFVLGASGHIAGVINPASKNKRNYWINGELGKGADYWLETAKSTPGSWWFHWSEWLKKQGAGEIPAPQTLGNEKYPPIEPAPGRYVIKRID